MDVMLHIWFGVDWVTERMQIWSVECNEIVGRTDK